MHSTSRKFSQDIIYIFKLVRNFKLNFGTLIKCLLGLKNCVHARAHVRIMYAKALERNL